MSSEGFEKLHESYQALYQELRHRCQRLPRCSGEERKRLLRDIEAKIEETNEELDEMEKELRNAPQSYRNQMTNKIRSYKRDVSKLQRDVRSSDLGYSAPRDFKYNTYNAENEESNQLASQRALLLQGTDSLNRATQSIERSHRIAIETDQVGAEIIEELGEQREQLERSKDRLINTGENLSKSRKILRAMSRKIVTNKLLLGIVILFEVAILGAVVYFKFFRHH
ncbi:vesicle transport through interaction with t-SNAREs homolog 1B [Callorhinchus milii]|uniref:Vesicle transport through interaction with t-SNAREs-like protein 1B n=2 Tax=Callorhinchus milii TaxID=7868 RepID=K4GGJ4_CALMI|nr:vesicle transport through interaction with t-SNAREs homolog 1B [Callorhinchus milii]AFM88199.1 vesicle transport through interaction with t-SNAREs-like protein 1B [Callorhinchus milii]AFM89463.1 vesicle transport through interaction with t-SNAREs-like protein 1B [Callorhinchus milii]|eukprot:gi/632942174/ref/XP_007886269.1/ PREDICTED: vesicle transport through interaction with t-SNAREs homolog 1B [Callorhinchus milii]